MQSLPSIEAVEKFAPDKKDWVLQSDVMKSHQKNMGGNAKMTYYLASNYRIPKNFEDLVYLTQLTQAEAMRDPTEHWRRNSGRCNGALYWQYNDCWGVSSWAGIDYYDNWKALNYWAKKFFAPVMLSLEDKKNHVSFHVVNDLLENFGGEIQYKVMDFEGNILLSGEEKVEISGNSAKKIAAVYLKDVLKQRRNKCVLSANLVSDGKVIAAKTLLFAADKFAEIKKPNIQIAVKSGGDGVCEIALKSDTLARSVMVKVKGIQTVFSDNFFDLLPNQEYKITFFAPSDVSFAEIEKSIEIKSVADIEPLGTLKTDRKTKWKIAWLPSVIIARIAQWFA
jgi:beta-mannosidase